MIDRASCRDHCRAIKDPAAEHDAWLKSARLCSDPVCDVFIQLADSVYVGPRNGMTPEQWRDERIPLPVPDLYCRLPGRVASADLPGREAALAAHYAALARVLTAHGGGAELSQPFPYFTLRPALLCGHTILADWCWSDSLPDATATLQQLAQAPYKAPGTVLLDDQEQGWRLLMIAGSGVLSLVEWDAEGPPPAGRGWQIPTAALARQAAEALARLQPIHTALCRHLERDPWS